MTEMRSLAERGLLGFSARTGQAADGPETVVGKTFPSFSKRAGRPRLGRRGNRTDGFG